MLWNDEDNYEQVPFYEVSNLLVAVETIQTLAKAGSNVTLATELSQLTKALEVLTSPYALDAAMIASYRQEVKRSFEAFTNEVLRYLRLVEILRGVLVDE